MPFTPPYQLLKSTLHRRMSCAWSLATRGLSNGRLTLVCNQHRCRVLVLQQPIRGRQCGLSHIFRLQNQWVFYITTGRSGWGHTEVSTCILHSREQEGRKIKKKKKKSNQTFERKRNWPISQYQMFAFNFTTSDLLKQSYFRETGRSSSYHQKLEVPHIPRDLGG